MPAKSRLHSERADEAECFTSTLGVFSNSRSSAVGASSRQTLRDAKRRKTGLNDRFDRMVETMSVIHRSPTKTPKRRKKPRSSSFSSGSELRTPVDDYCDVQPDSLGKDFRVIKMDASARMQQHLEADEGDAEPMLDRRSASPPPLPAWLASTFTTLSKKHPLRLLLPRSTAPPLSATDCQVIEPPAPAASRTEDDVFAFSAPTHDDTSPANEQENLPPQSLQSPFSHMLASSSASVLDRARTTPIPNALHAPFSTPGPAPPSQCSMPPPPLFNDQQITQAVLRATSRPLSAVSRPASRLSSHLLSRSAPTISQRSEEPDWLHTPPTSGYGPRYPVSILQGASPHRAPPTALGLRVRHASTPPVLRTRRMPDAMTLSPSLAGPSTSVADLLALSQDARFIGQGQKSPNIDVAATLSRESDVLDERRHAPAFDDCSPTDETSLSASFTDYMLLTKPNSDPVDEFDTTDNRYLDAADVQEGKHDHLDPLKLECAQQTRDICESSRVGDDRPPDPQLSWTKSICANFDDDLYAYCDDANTTLTASDPAVTPYAYNEKADDLQASTQEQGLRGRRIIGSETVDTDNDDTLVNADDTLTNADDTLISDPDFEPDVFSAPGPGRYMYFNAPTSDPSEPDQPEDGYAFATGDVKGAAVGGHDHPGQAGEADIDLGELGVDYEELDFRWQAFDRKGASRDRRLGPGEKSTPITPSSRPREPAGLTPQPHLVAATPSSHVPAEARLASQPRPAASQPHFLGRLIHAAYGPRRVSVTRAEHPEEETSVLPFPLTSSQRAPVTPVRAPRPTAQSLRSPVQAPRSNRSLLSPVREGTKEPTRLLAALDSLQDDQPAGEETQEGRAIGNLAGKANSKDGSEETPGPAFAPAPGIYLSPLRGDASTGSQKSAEEGSEEAKPVEPAIEVKVPKEEPGVTRASGGRTESSKRAPPVQHSFPTRRRSGAARARSGKVLWSTPSVGQGEDDDTSSIESWND